MSAEPSTIVTGTPPESAADYPTPPSYERVEQHVRVVVGDTVVAETVDAVIVRQTGIPPVWYLPRDNVRDEVLVTSHGSSHCPFKGDATYYALAVDGRVIGNAAWAYLDPLPEAAAIAGRVAFYAHAVDATVDGVPVRAPAWKWIGGWVLPWTAGPYKDRDPEKEASASNDGGAESARSATER